MKHQHLPGTKGGGHVSRVQSSRHSVHGVKRYAVLEEARRLEKERRKLSTFSGGERKNGRQRTVSENNSDVAPVPERGTRTVRCSLLFLVSKRAA